MRLRKSIFTKLIGSFILYAAVLVATFTLCLLLEVLVMTRGNPPDVYLGGFDGSGDVADLEAIQNIGGWVEELDDDCRIVRIYGEKKTAAESYTAAELLELTSIAGHMEYIGFFVQPEDSPARYLYIYDRDILDIRVTLLLNNVERQDVPGVFLLFFPLSLLEIVLISLYLKRKIKTPLDQIVAGMESLKSGDGGARIHIKTEAEFEKIIDTFNMMARQLEAEKAQRELLIQKKNRMLLELSHDIRTPIATIKSYVGALEEGLVCAEKLQNVYRVIDSKAGRVWKLSEDMFMMLKMDDADYRLCLEPVDLCEYLRQLCAEYYEEITEAGYAFGISIPDGPIPVSIDADLFARVAGNLLSNARRYNLAGKEILVALRSGGGRAVLTVSDDGQEIDEAFAGQMFQAFSRGDQARKTDGGTGLGLAISRIITEKHGGNIGYCRRDGKNVFTVELPSGSSPV